MEIDSLIPDSDSLTWWLEQVGVSHSRFASNCPDYLIVSPPKTGSTWLADNLRHHPEVFVPSMKEIKYFSSFFKSLDLNWYLDQMASGAGRVKGEASPSYALLPVERIRLIRRLVPKVKIVFLMRDPIGRAWSHARHNHRFREANFETCTSELAAVSDREWMENFTQDWTVASGDYLGQLRRWLSVFPREQVYIGFYESIANQPEKLLRDVFDFLGVRQNVDLSGFPVRERILAGPPGELSPSLRRDLHRLLHERTLELETFMRERLDLNAPVEWRHTLAALETTETVPTRLDAFARQFDDSYLSRILAREETFPTAWCPVLGAYQGFNLVFRRGLLFALDVNLGDVQPRDISEADLRRYLDDRRCFIASSIAAVKASVDQHHFDRDQGRLAELPALQTGLNDARLRVVRLERELQEAVAALRKVEVDLVGLRPWFVFVECVLRPAWRRLKSILGGRRRPRLERGIEAVARGV